MDAINSNQCALFLSCGQAFSPKQSEIVQRSKFYSHLRKPGENISSHVAELRTLAKHCNFGGTLQVMIRDRLVCGVSDDSI